MCEARVGTNGDAIFEYDTLKHRNLVLGSHHIEASVNKITRGVIMDHPLQEKIAARTLRVAVIGLGYVGLPLAITFAEAGFHVTGIDVDEQKIDRGNRG